MIRWDAQDAAPRAWRDTNASRRIPGPAFEAGGNPSALVASGHRPARLHLALGVEPAKRFEWTPLYFKELSLVGSNAFGFETVDGRRQHAMRWYLDWVREERLDVTPILTHHFPLRDYRQAFRACLDQAGSGAVKGVFDYREAVS